MIKMTYEHGDVHVKHTYLYFIIFLNASVKVYHKAVRSDVWIGEIGHCAWAVLYVFWNG